MNQEIASIFEEIVSIRRHIHQHPELSTQESETAAYIASLLRKWEIPHQAGVAGHGLVATIGNTKNPRRCIGLRADIDALPVTECTGLSYASANPGVMHACGHDMHTAILLGTGLLLKRHEQELIEKAGGCVKLFFQPSEETIGGARQMIEAGCLQDPAVDAVLALHIDPDTPTGAISLKAGPMNAAAQSFSIEVLGKACHGAHPEGGIDSIVMASQLVLALQSISSRFMAPTTPVIVTIGTIQGGTKGNIVAGSVTLTGTIRALDQETMDRTKALFVQIIEGTTAAYGGRAEIRFSDDQYPPLINDANITQMVADAAGSILGSENVRLMPDASLGADDFAFFTSAVPGCYFNLGVTPAGAPVWPLHNEHLAPDEEAMKTGIAIYLHTIKKMLG